MCDRLFPCDHLRNRNLQLILVGRPDSFVIFRLPDHILSHLLTHGLLYLETLCELAHLDYPDDQVTIPGSLIL